MQACAVHALVLGRCVTINARCWVSTFLPFPGSEAVALGHVPTTLPQKPPVWLAVCRAPAHHRYRLCMPFGGLLLSCCRACVLRGGRCLSRGLPALPRVSRPLLTARAPCQTQGLGPTRCLSQLNHPCPAHLPRAGWESVPGIPCTARLGAHVLLLSCVYLAPCNLLATLSVLWVVGGSGWAPLRSGRWVFCFICSWLRASGRAAGASRQAVCC